MPYKEKKVEKLYFTIGEVARMFDVIHPKKNKKGNRFFTKEDIDNFHLIFHLVKERGMTLKGAQMKLKENRSDVQDNFEIVKSLQDVKKMLLELKENLG